MTSIFDIETIALPEDQIRSIIPSFNPDKVALGNRSKPETVAAHIEECRANHGNDIVEKAALSPIYGQIAIAGFYDATSGETRQFSLADNTEKLVIAEALSEIVSAVNTHVVAGWNVKAFDMAFLVKRAWILEVEVPRAVFDSCNPRYPWSRGIVDMMEVFQCGNYKDSFTSANQAARILGLDPVTMSDGSKFGELWATDNQKALSYNADDLRLEREIADRIMR